MDWEGGNEAGKGGGLGFKKDEGVKGWGDEGIAE